MNLGFGVTTQHRRHLIHSSSSIMAVALVIANFVGNAVNNSPIAGSSLLGIIFMLVVLRSQSTNWCRGLVEVVLGVILFGYLIQIAGEVAGTWLTSSTAMTAFVSGILIAAFKTSSPNIEHKRISGVTMILTVIGATFWLLLLSLRSTTLVNFLGYGYDNAAYIAQTKMIASNHGTSMIEGGLTSWPTFLQDSAQAGPSIVATLFRLMGNQGPDSSALLSVFTLVSVAMALLSIIVPASAVARLQTSRLVTTLSTLALLATLGTGYLSRIWFSGYFASNFATMLLIILVTVAVSEQFGGPLLPILIVLTIAHVYLIFFVIATLFVIPVLAPSVKRICHGEEGFTVVFPPIQIIALTGFATLLLLPIRATRRSYGGSHFLVDGGIEYLPARFLLIWGAVFVLTPSIIIAILTRIRSSIIVPFLSLAMALSVAGYSLVKIGQIAYYPTKFVISLAISAIVVVVVQASKLPAKQIRSFVTPAVIVAVVIFVAATPPAHVFSTAYMGEAPRVIRSAISSDTEVVSAEQVLKLAETSRSSSRPILLISSQHESELNSRWVNTLSSFWNDSSWTSWMVVRTAIDSGDLEAAETALAESNLLVATDRIELYEVLSASSPTQICLISMTGDCEFR